MSFGCKVCQKSFQLLTDLLKHFKVHVHPETNNQKEQTFRDVTPNLECENEMNFDGTYDIIHKNQTNVQSEQSQNGLSISAKQFNPKEDSSTSKESSTKTVKVKEQNICEICKKSFSRKSYLKLHVKTVHDEVKEYKCEICGKTFGQNSELQIHGETAHNLIKPHECVSCDKSFGQKSTLDRHMKTVHEQIRG